jgi:putative membrane protein insertion efficiency factor
MLLVVIAALVGVSRLPLQAAAIGGLHEYHAYVSPVLSHLGVRCRFEPTCSRYAELAIEKYGLRVGLMKTGRRLLRCNPLTPQGTRDLP